MSVKVKICGIRHIESAEAAILAGADFLGFNFVLSSKRFINPMKAKLIIDRIRRKTATVGIFQNATIEEINEHIKYLKLDYVQLHGNEDEEFVRKIRAQVIKSLPLDHYSSHEDIFLQMNKFSVAYFLLDRLIQGQGEIIDMEKANAISQKTQIFLAGGLHPNNIADIVKKTNPFAVDVAGGIETQGIEDISKIQRFISNAKENG